MVENPCPICRAPAEPDRARNPYAPFCTRRCKTIDLGRWLGEGYRLPVENDTPSADATTASDLVPPRRQS